jgi:2,3-diketo-5-methylthio-1-phosphopentane phosphatase
MAPTTQHQHLLLFDFDHTVCDGNTDTWILRALPPLEDERDGDAATATTTTTTSPRARVLPPSLRNPSPGGWTQFMQSVFDYSHGQGVNAVDFRRELQSLPLTPGFSELLSAVEEAADKSSNASILAGVISDSNSLFIDWTLEAHGLDARKLFAGAGVHTNPAALCARGERLSLTPHEPAAPGHGCPRCPPNLCKSKRLRLIVEEVAGAKTTATARPKIAYVGDGGNDACPAASLQSGDVVFARKGMALDKHLSKVAVAAEVVRWESGEEILSWLRREWGLFGA